MKIMDRLAGTHGSPAPKTNEPDRDVLDPSEIRLVAEGRIERLADFASSSRLHTPDPKGDTPLHLAARLGNLAVCDLFIRSGADANSRNHDGQTPADVALAEGHRLAARLLYSLEVQLIATETARVTAHTASGQVGPPVSGAENEEHNLKADAQETERTDGTDDLDYLLNFEAEAEPEDFFDERKVDTISGILVALVSSATLVPDSESGNW